MSIFKRFVGFLSVTLLITAHYAQANDDLIEYYKAMMAKSAFWIAHPDDSGKKVGVYHFRKVIELDAAPTAFPVKISADNSYRFFVNGRSIAAGPQRSDLMHWRYDSVDLAPYLKTGKNVLAATVWNWGEFMPMAQHSFRTGFFIEGENDETLIANSGNSWKVIKNTAYSFKKISDVEAGGYYAAAPPESVGNKGYPWGWKALDYDTRDWAKANVLQGMGGKRGSHLFGSSPGWQLTPRTIPILEEKPIRFAAVRKSSGVKVSSEFLKGNQALSIAANSKASLLLDNSHLTNAYLVIKTRGGFGSSIKLTYAESLKNEDGLKLNRDEIESKTLSGVFDFFHPGEVPEQHYQSLWYRNYRYVQVDIETGNEPLLIDDLHGIFTGYPFEMNASFESDIPWLADMWEMNWRTARLCALDTYVDTPYYEQLQYVGDTRIQALISFYMSGDDRLVRQAINHFNYSRIPEGITTSRYPTVEGQYIPPFSLIWIAMVHDYWMHRDDPEYVKQMLTGTRGVLNWFEQKLADNDLVGPIPWWPFIDWGKEWMIGIPPGGKEGGSVVISLQFAYALQRAADLEEALGIPSEAKRYRQLSKRLIKAAQQHAWNDDRGLFQDVPGKAVFSQQTNTMALLVGAVPEKEKAAFMQRILDGEGMTHATYYFQYYVLEALREAGMADSYIERLQPWQDMLARGLTTTPENPDPTRSDSHAWSAHPNYGLLATVLGIRPAEAGFRSVIIEPHLGSLQRASGSMPHPAGKITVSLQRKSKNRLLATIELPVGLTGKLVWRNNSVSLKSGVNDLSI